MNDRADYTIALRELADWLDANPNAPIPTTNVLYAHVGTPVTVEAIASLLGLPAYRHDDVISTGAAFGPILYDAFASLTVAPLPSGQEPF